MRREYQAVGTFTYRDSVVGDVTISEGEYVYDPEHEAIIARPEMFQRTRPPGVTPRDGRSDLDDVERAAMNATDPVTLRWVCPVTARLHELDVTHEQAECIARGDTVAMYGAEHRRFEAEDGIARLAARLNQIDARRDEMVSRWPALKAVR